MKKTETSSPKKSETSKTKSVLRKKTVDSASTSVASRSATKKITAPKINEETIVYVASEASPFAATGGLGEVMGSLPKAVAKEGYRSIVILPLYQKISEAGYSLERVFDLMHVQLSMKSHIFSAFHLKQDSVEYYFIEFHEYFSRPGIYDWQGEAYLDNPLRFGFFNYAALELLRRLQISPLAIHVHDWPTALLPVIAHANYYFEPLLKNTRYILTIHNLAHQGVFERAWLERLHLPHDYFYHGDLEYHGKINFLKGGIAHSSAFNTVSNSYAHEILFADKGEFLENFIREQSFKLSGILNGIDLESYNPTSDKDLLLNYNNSKEKKLFQKKYLESLGISHNGVVFAFISRLSWQKGVDLILESMGNILMQYPSAIFLAMGSGENIFETGLHYLQLHFSDRIRYFRNYSPTVARSIYAASDIYLMPSRFEPCGLGQMIAARYGALPLVNPTGGLHDTILSIPDTMPLPKEKLNAIGFRMGNFSSYDLQETIHYALSFYEKKEFSKAQDYNMKVDFSWKRSALQYIDLYKGK